MWLLARRKGFNIPNFIFQKEIKVGLTQSHRDTEGRRINLKSEIKCSMNGKEAEL
jgi:hypothetical protein